MPTLCDRPAAAVLRARVTAAANRLGVADPLSELDAVFARTFTRPASDPAYRRNWLQPGALPLEWSFSEVEPDALRIEFQPFDPEFLPLERLRCATTELFPLVQARYGAALAAQFATTVGDDATVHHPNPKFGAFLGVVVRPRCVPQFKIYVELDPADGNSWHGVEPNIAGVVRHFRSVTVGAGEVAERIYFLCRDGLRLLDLEALCAALGMPHRFPGLLVTLLEFTCGEFCLPPRSVLLGIRRTAAATELKVELVAGLATSQEGLAGRVERLMAPASVTLFRRWSEIVHPEASRELPVSIVSIRATATQPLRLSVYATEPGGEP